LPPSPSPNGYQVTRRALGSSTLPPARGARPRRMEEPDLGELDPAARLPRRRPRLAALRAGRGKLDFAGHGELELAGWRSPTMGSSTLLRGSPAGGRASPRYAPAVGSSTSPAMGSSTPPAMGSSTSPDGGARPWTSKETDGAETLGPPLRAFSGLRLVHTRPFFASRCDGDAKWMLGMRLLLETGLDRQNNCPRRKMHLGHRLGLLLETALTFEYDCQW